MAKKTKESHAAYMRGYYAADPQRREKKRSVDREYGAKNRATVLARALAWYKIPENANQARKRNNRRAMMLKVKGVQFLGGQCLGCGVDHPAVLQFHHRDPKEKRFSVAQALTMTRKYSWDELETELLKCDLLCANCHHIYHSAWRSFIEGNVPASSSDRKMREAYRRYKFYLKALDFKGDACKLCGFNHPAALQFHHRDPTQKDFVVNTKVLTTPVKYPWDIIVSELDKCDVLCANCHSTIHCTWGVSMLTDPYLDEEGDVQTELERTVRAKWSIDGAKTLGEAAAMLRVFANELEEAEVDGWQFREPVEDDYDFLYRLSG